MSKLSEKTAANMEQLAQVTKFEKFAGPMECPKGCDFCSGPENPELKTPKPKLKIPNPKLKISNPKLKTPKPEPETKDPQNPKLKTPKTLN